MKFNVWTFIFQVINFFVLLWILRRLLYRPVREIMEKRRALIKKTMEDAEMARQDAASLKAEYEKKGAELEEVRRKTMDKAQEEAEARKLEILRKAEEDARRIFEKEKAMLELEKKRLGSGIREKAISVSLSYSSALLSGFSDENLHNRIMERLTDILPDIAAGTPPTDRIDVEVTSAYPLTEFLIEEVKRRLKTNSHEVTITSRHDPDLIAGAVVRISDKVYDASLKGQLKAFEQQMRKAEQ